MAALDELTAAWHEAMADPAFTGEFERLLREYAGVPSLLYDATKLVRARRRPDPAQARGPQPHRRAQDPQRARPGPAHPADGQDPGDRRDRRRPARCRLGHRGGVPRPGLRGLHGRGGHRAAGAQRGADAAARRRGGPGEVRLAHPQGRHQRGDPRLGGQRRPHRLPVRHRRRPAPVPVDGAGLLPRHRRRGPRPVPRADRRAARTRPSPAWAAAPTRSACSPPSSRTRTCSSSAARPPATASTRCGTPRRSTPGEFGVLHGARTFVLQDEDGQTKESHSISAGLDYPGVGPEHAYLAETGRASYRPVTDTAGDGRVRAAVPHRGDHPGDRVRARRRRRAAAGEGAAGVDDPGEPLRPRRQGHGHRDRVVRPGRTRPEDRGGPAGRPARAGQQRAPEPQA